MGFKKINIVTCYLLNGIIIMFISKKYKDNLSKYDINKEYHLDEAIDILHSFNHSKFDECIDISVNLGVDPKHADQLVRGTVSLPNGGTK